MARIFEPSVEQLAAWRDFVTSRPPHVQAVAERFEPWSLYRHIPTGDRVRIASFGEDENGIVTITMNVTADYNMVLFERQVFGVPPEALEPCDLPSEDEPRGTILTEDDTLYYINERRALNGLPPLEDLEAFKR